MTPEQNSVAERNEHNTSRNDPINAAQHEKDLWYEALPMVVYLGNKCTT